jgi:hypothetical protein
MPTPATDPRLTRILLAVSAFLLATTALLGVYVLGERARIAGLRAELLSRAELQRELLSSQKSDHAFYPHTRDGLSFVLNPNLRRATWKAPVGESYPINSLGLRGPEISPKPPGVTRVLLVGDSVLFGWKLLEEDKVSSQLQRLVSERLPAGNFEFLTVALPGWNIVDEHAFLESHIDRLAPDFVVWSLSRNDVVDSSTPAPPGVQEHWTSPQKRLEVPFSITVEFQKDLLMPLVRERWAANLSMIRSFRERYAVPTAVLWWRARARAVLDTVVEETGFPLPAVVVPARYRRDEARWCVAEHDCHPTAWGSRIVALGVLGQLIDLGIVPALALQPDEAAVVEAFARERARVSSKQHRQEFFDAGLALIPRGVSDNRRQRFRSVLYGLRNDKLLRNGALYLRDKRSSAAMKVVVSPPPNPLNVERSVVFRLRNRAGDERIARARVLAPRAEVEIPLPRRGGGDTYELSWEFDYSVCTGPTFCHAGELVQAGFVGAGP